MVGTLPCIPLLGSDMLITQGITVLMALNVLNGPLITKFRLSIVVSSMLVYLLVPNRYIQILAGILFIIQMLVVLVREKVFPIFACT